MGKTGIIFVFVNWLNETVMRGNYTIMTGYILKANMLLPVSDGFPFPLIHVLKFYYRFSFWIILMVLLQTIITKYYFLNAQHAIWTAPFSMKCNGTHWIGFYTEYCVKQRRGHLFYVIYSSQINRELICLQQSNWLMDTSCFSKG